MSDKQPGDAPSNPIDRGPTPPWPGDVDEIETGKTYTMTDPITGDETTETVVRLELDGPGTVIHRQPE